MTDFVATILAAYKPLHASPSLSFEEIGISQLYIPRFPLETILSLCDNTIEALKKEHALLKLHGDFVVIGDIHGNLRDLLRLLASIETMQIKLLFLGDYVDRGSFSIEVLILLFAMKVVYPENVFLIRGNHEFGDINKAYGFREQILGIYNKELYEKFNEVFTYLPLAVLLNSDTFCVHGGISPLLTNIDMINRIRLPSLDFTESEFCQMVTDIIWSDPINTDEGYMQSPRGYGYFFGEKAVNEFIEQTKVKRIVRGHQCIAEGVRCSFGEKLYTVFSSSNYATDLPNKSGMLFVPTFGKPKIVTFNALPVIECERVHYRNFTHGQVSIPVPQRTLRSSMLLTGHRTPGALKRKLPIVHISPAMSSTSVSALKKPPPKSSTFNFDEQMGTNDHMFGRKTHTLPKRLPTKSVDNIF